MLTFSEFENYKRTHPMNDRALKAQFAETRGYILEVKRRKNGCGEIYSDNFTSTLTHINNQHIHTFHNSSSRNKAFDKIWNDFITYYK